MTRAAWLVTIMAWAGVWAFWLATTRAYHPTSTLAVIVTTSLVVAYAAAAYVNHLALIPRYARAGRWGAYLAWLGLTMTTFTAAALAIIRAAYFQLWGPDADPNGAVKHFAIDLGGMAAHLVAVASIVGAARWLSPTPRPLTSLNDEAPSRVSSAKLGGGLHPTGPTSARADP